jgi:hypothetical protein
VGVQPGLLRGYSVDSANRSGVAFSAGGVPLALNLLAAAQVVARGRSVARCLARAAGGLELIDENSTFYLAEGNRLRERSGFALARPTSALVEIHHHDVPGFRSASRPRAGEATTRLGAY